MKPLRVALVTKANSPNRLRRDDRSVGYFSYAVPEFTWEHQVVWKKSHTTLDLKKLAARDFDLVFHEDGAWCSYKHLGIPVVYYVVDSTLSDGSHYLPRLKQARKADLVLVDHDKLERYAETGKPVRRLSYCVNDMIFRDHGLPKTVDVASHMNVGGTCGEGRKQLGKYLGRWCGKEGYSYRGGPLGSVDYAKSFNAARITANWPRTPLNRSHRVLDAMACRTCLVTGTVPNVSGEHRVAGRDYVAVQTHDEFYLQVEELLASGRWRDIADQGHKLVRDHHTWATRAKELRQILSEELGL